MSCVSVKDLIGIPYKVHGRNPKEGLDCYGLDIEVFKRNGIYLPDVDYDSPEEYENVFMKVQHSIKYEKVKTPNELNIIMFRFRNEPRHTGVYLGHGLFIHSTRDKGVIVEPLHRWKNRVEGYYNVCIC